MEDREHRAHCASTQTPILDRRRSQRDAVNRKNLMRIVQCAKAPDAKQLVNQVPMPYPLFPLEQYFPPADASSAAATRAKSTLNGPCCCYNEPQSGRD